MDTFPLCLLVLASVTGSFASEDLQGKVFVFPQASSTAAVFVTAQIEHPLTSFTVCLRQYTLLTGPSSLFSYATKTVDNELLIEKPTPNQYRLYLGGSIVTFVLPEKQYSKYNWEHICISWESATGLVTLWVNGSPLPRLGLQKGYSISPEASVVLGQDQDSYGGGFESKEAFVGEMKHVYMWDRVLSSKEVFLATVNGCVNGTVIDWRALNYEIKGYVVLQPALSPAVPLSLFLKKV